MPYIEDAKRPALEFEGALPITPGDLNYAVTSLCHRYIAAKGLTYASINEVVGVLECAKLELYRSVVAPYEDVKREENGPVSELDGLDAAPAAVEAAPADASAILTQLKALIEGAQAAPQTAAPRRRRAAAPKPPTPPQAPPEGSQAAKPEPAKVSSVRRPAQVIGEDPGNQDTPNGEAIQVPSEQTQRQPAAPAKGVDRHVADVWERAARGNGEDDDF